MAIGINKLSERPEQEYAKMAKKVLLGSSRPPLFTRIILLLALICFGYYFIWNGLRVVVLSNIDSVENPELFKQKLQALGDEHGITDALKTFKNYGMAMVFTWLACGIGMGFIYRRKLAGYYVFFAGLLAALIIPFVLLGWSYSTSEVDWYDFVIPPALFAIFFISFKRLKKLKEEARLEGL